MPSDLLRKIWSNPNCVLLVFAGSSAELEYSMRGFPFVFGRELSRAEKDLLVRDFLEIGELMQVPGLPEDFAAYAAMRRERYQAFAYSMWTAKLLASYKRAIGLFLPGPAWTAMRAWGDA